MLSTLLPSTADHELVGLLIPASPIAQGWLTPGALRAWHTDGLAPLAAVRREPALDVGEPTKAVLLETPKQFRAVEVIIREPVEA